MAKKKPAKKEVSRKEINGNIIITFDDGSVRYFNEHDPEFIKLKE